MKRWIYVTGLMVMFSLGTMAQRKGGDRPTAEERANRSTEKMAEELTLTEAQQKQLLAINLEFAKKAVLKEQDAKIQAVLTEEQRTKLTELKAERMNDPRRRRPNAQIEGDPRKGKRGGGN